MKNKRLFVILLLVLPVLFFVLFIKDFKRKGIYSYTTGEKYGFTIGQPKATVLKIIGAYKENPFFQVKSRQPYVLLDKYLIESKNNTVDILKSDYWIFSPNWPDLAIFVFRDGNLCRILEYHRPFGELNGSHFLFDGHKDLLDIFKGLSSDEIDQKLIDISGVYVYFDTCKSQ